MLVNTAVSKATVPSVQVENSQAQRASPNAKSVQTAKLPGAQRVCRAVWGNTVTQWVASVAKAENSKIPREEVNVNIVVTQEKDRTTNPRRVKNQITR